MVNSTDIVFTGPSGVADWMYLYAVPKIGNAAWSTIGSAEVSISPIALDDTYAYFNAGSIALVPDAGANNVFGSPGESPWAGVGVDATYVYWIQPGTGDLWREAKNAPFGTTATATDVYVVDGTNGGVWRIPLSGAVATEVGHATSGPVVTPKGIVWADGSNVRAYVP